MKYTIEYINSRTNREILDTRDTYKLLTLQKATNSIHNQNRILIDFAKSKIFNDNRHYDKFFIKYKSIKTHPERVELQRKLYTEIRDQYKKLDRTLSDKRIEELNYDLLKPYITFLARHIDALIAADTYTYTKYTQIRGRWPLNRMQHTNSSIYQDIERSLEIATSLETLYKEGGYSDKKLNFEWHLFLSTSWALIEAGVGEVALYFSKLLQKYLKIHLSKDHTALQNVFKALHRSSHIRCWCTVLWIKVSALLQLQRFDEAKETLKKIINIYEEHPQYGNYVLNNRIVEACILLCKLEPTQENKNKAKKLFIANCNRDIADITESTRERGLIVYDFCKYVLNKDI
tara:strand:- start:1507 stop:2544 length:1038 start_codon:yes stop_codon:yes gene_type:complete